MVALHSSLIPVQQPACCLTSPVSPQNLQFSLSLSSFPTDWERGTCECSDVENVSRQVLVIEDYLILKAFAVFCSATDFIVYIPSVVSLDSFLPLHV